MLFETKSDRNRAIVAAIDGYIASGVQKSVAVRRVREEFGIFTEATVYRIYKLTKSKGDDDKFNTESTEIEDVQCEGDG